MKFVPMMKSAFVAVQTCLGVKPDEKVLVVTDTDKVDIAMALWAAAHAIGADAILTVMKPRAYQGEELPEPIAEIMKASDVIFITTAQGVFHTKARMEATKAGARIAAMPHISEDMMTVGGMTADYGKVSELSWKLAKVLEKGKNVRITTPAGTSLTMRLVSEERLSPPIFVDHGLFVEPGSCGNLPAGEAEVTPVEELTEGTAVIDGSMVPVGIIKDPIILTIERGKVVKIDGKTEAVELKKYLEGLQDPNAYWVGELGFGTNEKARVTGKVLEDEKVLGTVHIGLGTNVSMGGKIQSKTHIDGVMLNPTVELDGKTIIKDGQLLIK